MECWDKWRVIRLIENDSGMPRGKIKGMEYLGDKTRLRNFHPHCICALYPTNLPHFLLEPKSPSNYLRIIKPDGYRWGR